MLQSIQEIANDFGTSRQYVFQTLRSALRKIYIGMKRHNPTLRPFELMGMIVKEFPFTNEKDLRQFYLSFPTKIRKEVTIDALKLTRINPNTSLEDILYNNVRRTKQWDKKKLSKI